MTTTRLLAALTAILLPSLAALPAQDGVRDVPKGREIRESKLLSPGLTDAWKLRVAMDEMLWCTVDSAAFDPVLEIVDADGKVLGTHDGEGTHSELWLRMPHAGPVEVRVRPYQGSGGGQYHLWLQRFRTESLGASDEKAHTFGEEQWWHYRVALREGDVLVPSVSGAGNLTLVCDTDRRALHAHSGGYRAPHTGDYFLRVEGRQEATCTLATQLARQREIHFDHEHDEKIGAHGLDLWRLPVKRGTIFALDLTMPSTMLDVDLRDTEPDDRGPRFHGNARLDKGGHLLRYYHVVRDGTLELSLRNHSHHLAPYRVSLSTAESNLDPGTPAKGKLDRHAGALHRLHAQSGQLLRLTARSQTFDAKLDLFGIDGEAILRLDDSGPLDLDPSSEVLILRTGDYRILIHGEGSGDYTLSVETLDVPSIAAGERQTIRLHPTHTRYLHLPLRAGQEVWLALRCEHVDPLLNVLDPSGDGAFSIGGQGIGGTTLAAYRASHDGVHTLRLSDRAGKGGDCELRVMLP